MRVLVTGANRGIGAALMEASVEAAKIQGWDHIILVGDLSYYGKFGFKVVPRNQIVMPGPVDAERLLYCPLQNDSYCPAGVAAKLLAD